MHTYHRSGLFTIKIFLYFCKQTKVNTTKMYDHTCIKRMMPSLAACLRKMFEHKNFSHETYNKNDSSLMVPLCVGQYGLVYEADWVKSMSGSPTRVAVKTLKGDW